ncbi:hypothetical protein [Ornithinimicrobium tianjinense]|uniref:Uncharacterized protein n=1 Tax=Ornithinimicrobium tianjinense TaxID=1195761 RepID=A0A917BDU5_9MICO|nr:hypothetical protein [Ornithinimicrobium tianjinense]GGF38697.1 hypothetical protein GCM10011366_02850 [Ornithinimicrobium tianjinense]
MSDPQITDLLDRAVHHAPAMHLDADDMLAAGRGRVRRRRATAAGALAGSLAVVAAVWGGLTGGSDLLGTREIQPATTVFEEGETFEATLFDGFQTVDDDQVGHSYDVRLSRTTADGAVTLVLSDGGAVVEEVQAESPVPGLEVFAGERLTVALWVEPEGVVASVPLVGPVDPGGPSDVRHTDVDGQQVAYAVWAGDVVPMPDAVRDVYLVGHDDVVTLSGRDLETAELRAGDEHAVVWSDPSVAVWGYAVTVTWVGLPPQTGLSQFVDGPAMLASSSWTSEDGTVGLSLLPDGAGRVETVDGGDLASTTLDGRAVVLTDTTGPTELTVRFGLGGTTYTVQDYSADLFTLDTADGTAASLQPRVEARDPALALVAHSGARLLEVGDGHLLAGPVVRDLAGGAVVLVTGGDPVPAVLTDLRVEVAGRWVTPVDVAQVLLADGRIATAASVAAAADEVTAVGRLVNGQVERWSPGAG